MNMKHFLIALVMLAVVPLANAATHHAHAHTHGDAAHVSDNEVPGKGERWSVDAPLQAGMGKIRNAVGDLRQLEHGDLAPRQVQMRAAEIEKQVRYLIANCKLDPKADARLHIIIGQLLGAAKALAANPDDAAPVAQLRAALAEYPKYFNDSTWVALGD